MQGEDSINRYISLHEATKYCHYSQEYLSLRVRQGKLKAIKSGRNWVTKKEWVEEYVKKVGDYNNNLKIKKSVLPAETLVKAGAPPENLPVDLADQSADLRGYQRGFTLKEFFKISQPRFALVVGMTFVLLTAGVVFGKENLKSAFEDLDPYVQKIVGSFDKGIVKGWERINQGVGEIGEVGDLAIKEVFETAKGVVFETSSRLEEFNQDFGNGVVQLNQKLKVLEGIPLKAVSYGAGKIQRLAGNVSGYTYIVGEAGDIVIEEIGKSFTGSFATVAEDIQNLQSQLKNSAKFVSKSFLEELSFFTELSRSESEGGEEEIFFDFTLR